MTPKEESKQLTDLEIAIKLEEIQREEPKQETLEELAEIGEFAEKKYLERLDNFQKVDFKDGCFEGYKLAQERMYSDMQEYAEFCIRCYEKGMPCIIAKDWFEQFKKKTK